MIWDIISIKIIPPLFPFFLVEVGIGEKSITRGKYHIWDTETQGLKWSSHFFYYSSNIYFLWNMNSCTMIIQWFFSFLAHRDISPTEFKHRQVCYFWQTLPTTLVNGDSEATSVKARGKSWFKMQPNLGEDRGAPSECLCFSSFSAKSSSWQSPLHSPNCSQIQGFLFHTMKQIKWTT